MSEGRNIIDNLRYFDKYNQMQEDNYIKYKIASQVEKEIPAYNENPIELNEFCKKMKSVNPQFLKDIVYLLGKEKKIVLTTNRKNQTFFQRVMLTPKS